MLILYLYNITTTVFIPLHEYQRTTVKTDDNEHQTICPVLCYMTIPVSAVAFGFGMKSISDGNLDKGGLPTQNHWLTEEHGK